MGNVAILGKIRDRRSILLFIAFIISLLCTLIFYKQILKFNNVLIGKEHNIIKIHVKENKNRRSFDRRLYLTDLKINNDSLNLSNLSTDEWIWYDEYQYLVFQGDDEDLIIFDSDDPIDSFEIDYYGMEAGGIVDYYLNEEIVKTVDTYFNEEGYWDFRVDRFEFADTPRVIMALASAYIIIFIAIFGLLRGLILFTNNTVVNNPISLATFNYLKGIGIILVVLKHSMNAFEFDAEMFGKSAAGLCLIVLFYGLMPMFFILSGYGFRKEKIGLCIRKQFIFLVRPVITLAFFVAVFSFFKVFFLHLSIQSALTNILSVLLMVTKEKTVLGITVVNMGPVWFVLALFFGWIILDMITQSDNRICQILAVVGCFVVAFLLNKYRIDHNIIAQSFLAVTFLYLGYLIKKTKTLTREKPYMLLLLVFLAIISIPLSLFNGTDVVFSSNDFGRVYGLGVVLCAFWGYFLIYLFVHIPNSVIKKMAIAGRLGQRTLDLICIHTFWLLILSWEEVRNVLTGIYVIDVVIVFIIHWILIGVTYYLKRCIWDKLWKRTI